MKVGYPFAVTKESTAASHDPDNGTGEPEVFIRVRADRPPTTSEMELLIVPPGRSTRSG